MLPMNHELINSSCRIESRNVNEVVAPLQAGLIRAAAAAFVSAAKTLCDLNICPIEYDIDGKLVNSENHRQSTQHTRTQVTGYTVQMFTGFANRYMPVSKYIDNQVDYNFPANFR